MSMSFTPSLAHAVSVATYVVSNERAVFSDTAMRDAHQLMAAFNIFCDAMKAYRRGELPLREAKHLHAVVLDRAIEFQASSGLELGLFGS